MTGGIYRSAKVLRLKYDVLKRDLKKKINYNKVQQFKTGGGKPDIKPLTSYEEELFKILSLSIEGLPSRHDGDTYVGDNDEFDTCKVIGMFIHNNF